MKKFPNAFVILLGFIVLVGVFTRIIPPGEFERVPHPQLERDMVVPGSYHFIASEPLSVAQMILAIPEGLISAAELIILILFLGGSFYVIEKTGALRAGVLFATHLLKGREGAGIVIMSLLFATAGAVNGMQEEIIALTPVLLFFTARLGFTALATVAVSYGSAVLGSSLSPMNPFAVTIAQKLAELPLLSGGSFRMAVFAIGFLIWTLMILRYARRNRVEKALSADDGPVLIGRSHATILILTVLAFALMIYGLLWLDWGFNEMSAEFFVLGILAGIIGRLGLNGTTEAYIDGFKEMTFAAVLMGLAKSITLIMQQAMIIDTLIYGLFTPLQYLPKSLAAIAMMIAQSLLHFPVPSYSGQAVMTLPILVPLSDLMGISRQVCVLAYQYGAVLTDLLTPTNGALMAIITIAGISYKAWIRFIIGPTLVIMTVCAMAIALAVSIGY